MNDSPPIPVPMRTVRKQQPSANRVFLPRELRDAIPEQHRGRDLVLDSITAGTVNSLFLGPQIRLKLLAKETGKLRGEFTISVSMEPEAARALAATLAELADHADHKRRA